MKLPRYMLLIFLSYDQNLEIQDVNISILSSLPYLHIKVKIVITKYLTIKILT